jgi:hypothetical protein
MRESPRIKVRPDGIVEIFFGDSPSLDVDSLRRLFNDRQALAPGRRRILIHVTTSWPTVAEGADYSVAAEVIRETTAVAFVGGWALLGSMTDLHVIKHQVPYPMRHFADADDALAWLNTFLDHDK